MRIFATDCKAKWKVEWGMYADMNWQAELRRLFTEIVDYILATGIAYHLPVSLNDTMDEVKAHRKLKLDLYNDPKAVAKRERARARRLANEVIGA
jgi:hypothetical protein